MRIVVVAKTRMRDARICVGAHDLDTFRSLRLFREDGTYLGDDAELDLGDIWEVEYQDRAPLTPPHLEDVVVRHEGARRVGHEPELAALIARRDVVWVSVDELFEGCLRFSDAGSGYVPIDGPLPSRSTGYWRIDWPLTRSVHDERVRYRSTGPGALRSLPYVGLVEPVETVLAGTLVRLSLSHPFPLDNPIGYWLQLSGWY